MGPAGGGPAHQQVAVVPRAGGGGARGPDAAAPHPVPVLQGPSPYIIIIISVIVIIIVIGGQWTDAPATLQLTHLLRDSLGGNCKTLLIANLRGELEQVRPLYYDYYHYRYHRYQYYCCGQWTDAIDRPIH